MFIIARKVCVEYSKHVKRHGFKIRKLCRMLTLIVNKIKYGAFQNALRHKKHNGIQISI